MIIPFIVAAAVIAVDQISKYIVKTNMTLYESFPFIKYILNFNYIENEGASWGILKDHRWVFMSLSSVALVFMLALIIYLGRKPIRKNNLMINISLAFMFGGGIGNMIDRFFNESAAIGKAGKKVVVDFLEFDFLQFENFKFPVFNIADSFICIGSVLLCACMFAGKYKLKGNVPFQKGAEDETETENI